MYMPRLPSLDLTFDPHDIYHVTTFVKEILDSIGSLVVAVCFELVVVWPAAVYDQTVHNSPVLFASDYKNPTLSAKKAMASFESIMKKFLEGYEKQSEDTLVKEFMVRERMQL